MFGTSSRGPGGPRWGIVAVAALLILSVAAADPAEAARYRKKRGGGGYQPPYAAIVVDVNSGEVLHASNADSIRHPASLTKIMTLYLLFEQIEAGRLKLDSDLKVSAHAASQAPSKLGLRPGQTVEVEDAIKALVTKSANDVAVVVAEAIAGDEEDFAKLMTRKARALGMARTVYANASGLPNPDQVTTARDQATLGRAIQDRFPRLYRYFSTHTFHYHGRGMRNHNRLLGRVAGVDGIKTGYIRASGFNLVASMRRNDRHVVAVVMGGASGRARDARMHQLLEGHIVQASVRRTAPKIAEVPAARVAEATDIIDRRSNRMAPQIAAADPMPATADPRLPIQIAQETPPARLSAVASAPLPVVATPTPGSAEPIRPVMVKTVSVKRGAVHAGMGAMPVAAQPAAAAVYATASHTGAPPPAPRPGVLGTLPARQVASAGDALPVAAIASETTPAGRPSHVRGEWMIQIGAYPEEEKAKEKLRSAQSVARSMLAAAAPFTEPVVKGNATFYRARFAGFDQNRAEAACKYLKRNEFECLALKN
jgi:D-alanyl-D-alanine carboxypeptidase